MTSFLRKFLGNFAWVAGGSFFDTFINFLSSLLIVLNLSVFDYGLMALSISIVSIMSSFSHLGLTAVVSSDIAQELGKKRFGRAKELLASFSKFVLVMGLIISFAVFLFSESIAGLVSRPDIASLLQIAALMIFLEALRDVFHLAFESSLHFKYFSIMRAMESLSRLAFVSVFIHAGAFSLDLAFLAYPLSIATSIALSLAFLLRTIHPYRRVASTKQGLFKKMLTAHGKFVIIKQPFMVLTDNLSLWAIEFVLGVRAVGLYALAWKIYTFISLFVKSLEKVLIPTISYEIVRNKGRVKRLLTRGMKYGLFVSSIAALLAIVFITPFLSFIGLERYYPSVPVLNVILLNLILAGFSYLIRPLFFALKAQKELTMIYIPTTFSFVALLFPLLYLTKSPQGAAIALVLNTLLVIMIRIRVLFRLDPELRPTWRDFFRIDKYDKDLFRRIVRGAKRGKKD